MYLTGGFTALAILGLLMYLPCWVIAAVFRFVLQPLEIPSPYFALAARERRLTIVAYLTLFLIGIPVLVLFYLIGLIRHVRSQSESHGRYWVPLVPRFSMSDMLAMVFSLGCTPALYQASHVGRAPEAMLFVFFASLLTFPAFFLAALYRLNLHGVPSGGVRMALLGLTPFIAVASAGVIPYSIFSLSGEKTPTIAAVVFLLILLAGRLLARKAAELGQAHVAAAMLEVPAQP